ncbi:3-hydroxyacyl-CoA dehydrogenase family protein [Cupriavidus sp. 30B13]|uniref:3-hydroxyacyl-CoA dehydrogenase family protein n=1 Tax=Cupriavidus sp. 30B13 TaxID=3384241 RepID=UPI003B8FF660
MTFSKTIGVAGAGLMGSGIAAKFAAAGYDVLVYDSAAPSLARVQERCAAIFAELVRGEAMTPEQAQAAQARVGLAQALGGLAACAIVIEAINEVLEAKQALFAALEANLPAGTPIASSTSGFTPERLAEKMANPERFLVAHFWNPPHLVPLVEVLPAPRTGGAVVDAAMALLRDAQCEPVLLKKAVPGFIGNRIQFAVLREALHLLREGVADAATIDLVMKQSLGRRYGSIGPLEGADVGGLDTFLAISTHLMPELAKDEDVLELLRAHVERGERGRASGQGFYAWDAAREAWLAQVRLKMLKA